MQYIKVKNNVVDGLPQDLPASWGNISNFYALDLESLKNYGWYPYEQEDIILNENEIIVEWVYHIEENKVIRRAIKRELTVDEINHQQSIFVEKKWEKIRTKRNELLLESDWTQLQDVEVPNKQSWILYRKSLRDITKTGDPELVIWPSKPPLVEIFTYVPPTPSLVEEPQPETSAISESNTNTEVEPSPIEETTNEEVDPNLGG